ncbi:MAG: PQQ-binding-like beta-propeller repeat protein [Phycisphaerae bacterium]|nr:PQQ-binding-like beta-propeller repeat protein [Phycisphaerae bacterium]
MVDWLRKAQKSIKQKDYSQAIKILQALIEKQDGGFIQIGDKHKRLVTLQVAANMILGSMPPGGLERYRNLYDPKAQKKYGNALARGKIFDLQRVATFYRHSSFGPKALGQLAAWQFDHGRFLQAAGYWRQLGEQTGQAEALRLAKLAAAYHLGGDDVRAKKTADMLRMKFAESRAVVGGREQSLTEFVGGVFAMPTMTRSAARKIGDEYPGWGGIPDGLAVMDDSDVVLVPRWRYPKPASSQKNIYDELIPRTILDWIKPTRNRGRNSQAFAELRGGNVCMKTVWNQAHTSKGKALFSVPAILRPVVVGNQVIYRDAQRVRALDIYTGRLQWESRLLPLKRRGGIVGNRGIRWLIDCGRYSLTAGGNKVYTVYNFPPFTRRSRGWGVTVSQQAGKSSSLAALSISGEGKIVWDIGNGRGSDDFLKTCTYISPPTYQPACGGPARLYVMALHLETYYLLCLSAATGEMIWKTEIAQTPPSPGRSRYGFMADENKLIGTPPAISDGRVFVTTNSGVTAACDAQFGQVLWANQYSTPTVNRRGWRRYNSGITMFLPNPIIVANGRVICMPADYAKVMALSVEDGKEIWKQNRDKFFYLTGVDHDRILISGDAGAKLLSTRNGETLFKAKAVRNPTGRPAVTHTQILITGDGVLQRLSWVKPAGGNGFDYKVSYSRALEPGGLLGNLISVGGKLIAANALGLCGYCSYADTYNVLAAEMKGKAAEPKTDVLFQRAYLSYSAGKLERTLADFQAVEKLLDSFKDSNKARMAKLQLRQGLYRTYVAMGNVASTLPVMLENFTKASRLAETPQEKGHMLIRMAKYHEKIGQFSRALDVAHEIAKNFPSEDLVNVQIGSDADNRLFGKARLRRPGYYWARDFTSRLIQIHGREIYAKFDAQAKKVLDAARSQADAQGLHEVAKRWPHSKWVDEADFAAAEILYRQGQASRGKQAKKKLARVTQILNRIAGKASSPQRASAMVALLAIYKASGWAQSARLTRNELANLPQDTKVAFADMRGTLAEVLKTVEKKKVPVKTDGKIAPFVSGPLRPVFSIADTGAYILTDQNFRPVHIDNMILMQKGRGFIFLNPSASDISSKAHIKTLKCTGRDKSRLPGIRLPGTGVLAGRTADGKVVVVVDQRQIIAFDTATGKQIWSKIPRKLLKTHIHILMAVGDGLVILSNSGRKVVAVEMVTGKVAWEAQLPKGQKASMIHGYPLVKNRLAVFLNNSKKTIIALSLKTGKLLYTKTSKTTTWVSISPNGLLVTLADGVLRVARTSDPAKILWQKKYNAGTRPRLLGVSQRYIAVRPDHSGRIEVLPLSQLDKAKPIVLTYARPGKWKGLAFSATFDGENIYVWATSFGDIRMSSSGVSVRRTDGLFLTGFNLRSRKRLWSTTLAIGNNKRLVRTQPMVVGQKHLVITTLYETREGAGYCYIIDKLSGKLAQKIDLLDTKKGRGLQRQRLKNIGGAVMTGGRLVLETEEGITVYGGE